MTEDTYKVITDDKECVEFLTKTGLLPKLLKKIPESEEPKGPRTIRGLTARFPGSIVLAKKFSGFEDAKDNGYAVYFFQSPPWSYEKVKRTMDEIMKDAAIDDYMYTERLTPNTNHEN
jgi:hypothetical protein